MTIHILGTTRVDGVAGDLTRRDAVVLSALCLRPGESVSRDTIADALWRENPPKSASKVVQGAIVRLRKLLGTDVIETTHTGYRVHLSENDDLDARQFERLVARARSFTLTRDHHRAAMTFEQSLALWSGDAFSDLGDWDAARAEAARLLEVRRAAEEERLVSILAAGRANEAVALARSLVEGEPYREHRWCLLALALYRTGRQEEALSVLRHAMHTLWEDLGLTAGEEMTALQRRVLEHDPSLLEVAARPSGEPSLCPYPGLRAFDTSDADYFFGREALVAEAVNRLDQTGLLVVVGPSGSGKSSLVRAGLVPALRRKGYQTSVIIPGSDPSTQLDATLGATSPARVLVVDQLEEAFTGTVDPEQAARFCDRLAELIEAGTHVVATVRADHLGGLAVSPWLARLAERALLLLTPMTADELREAIEAPANQVGLVLESGLVDLLLRDVLGEPGGLPLLSHALVSTWERRHGMVLTVDGYQATGGIREAVAQSAERLYESLAAEDRTALRLVLHRLVTPTTVGDPTVAHIPTRVFDSTPGATRLLDLLVQARLVTTTAETVSIAHESLVRAWPRLRTWLDEDVDGQRIMAHLQVAADGWVSLGRPPDELYRGARLAAALEWKERAHPVLAPAELEFISASQDHEADEARRHQLQLESQVRRNRQLRVALAVAATLLVVAAVAGVVAVTNARQASSAATAADAGRLGALAASGVAYDRALLYAVQAVALDDSPASDGALFATLLRGDAVTSAVRAAGGITGLAFTESGDRLVATTVNGHLLTYPSDGGAALSDVDLHLQVGIVAPIAGGAVAIGTQHGVWVVEPGSGTVLEREPDVSSDSWTSSPDASTIVSNVIDSDGVRIAAVALWRRGSDRTTNVALSAPPSRVLGCGARTACILTSDSHLVRVRYDDGTIASDISVSAKVGPDMAVSADGSRVALPRSDGLIEVVDPRTGAVQRLLPGGSRRPVALAFSPDGRQLAGADSDTVLVWRLDVEGLAQRYVGHSGRVFAAAWSPDGTSLATGATDNTIMRWDVVGGDRMGRIVTSRLDGDTSTLWPTDEGVVVGQFGGRLLLVDPDTGEIHELRSPTPGADVSTARSAPGGRLLITADTNGTTTVWDLRARRSLGTVELPPVDPRLSTADTWVSPDGTLAATIRDDTGIEVIDLAQRRVVRRLPLPAGPVQAEAVQGWTADAGAVIVSRILPDDGGSDLQIVDAATGDVRLGVRLAGSAVYEVAPDPRGRFLAVVMADGTLRVLDAHDGSPLTPTIQAVQGEAFNVSVSPDGSYIAVSGWPPQLTLWDTRTFRQVGIALPLDVDAQEARARFGPDDKLVVASGDVLRQFDIDPVEWRQRACELAARRLDRSEYAAVLPGRPYEPAC